MSDGLGITFQVLSRINNDAATSVLIAALESPHRAIAEEALRAILKRPSPAGHREVLSRLHALDNGLIDVIRENRGRLTTAIRGAILGSDPHMCNNGFQAVLWFAEYDLIPALINAAEDESNPNCRKGAGAHRNAKPNW